MTPDPPDGRAWDLLVIGGGSGGLVGARTAAGFGASVLLVERDRLGGECLWTGCVPSKALLMAAAGAAKARAGEGPITMDRRAVWQRVHSAVDALAPHDSATALAADGVCAVHGVAHFEGPGTVTVDGGPVPFRRALLATGSEPALPAIPGLREANPLTSDTLWGLPELPRQLVVLGGGSIGCEIGQALARLGCDVTVVEAAPQLLPREDPDAADRITAALRRDGARVHTAATVTGIVDGEIVLASGERVAFDRLLVATGRSPRTAGLGLRTAGVRTDRRGYVVVDPRLRTSNPRVYAAGDVTGHPQFTHTAGVHGSVAAGNAVLGLRRRADVMLQPRVTFTDPRTRRGGCADSRCAAGGMAAHHRPRNG